MADTVKTATESALSNEESRTLIKEKPTKKTYSPLAEDDHVGRLFCVLCKCEVENEVSWTDHVNGNKHQETLASHSLSSTATAKRPLEDSAGAVSTKKSKSRVRETVSSADDAETEIIQVITRSTLPKAKISTTFKKHDEIVAVQKSNARRYEVRNSKPIPAPRPLKTKKATASSRNAMEPAPFHHAGVKVFSQDILADGSLVRRGLNREVRIGFRYSQALPEDDKHQLLIRFSKSPANEDPVMECHPLNLAVNLNGADIIQPVVVDFNRKYRFFYSPIEVELKNALPKNNTLSLSWTAEVKENLQIDQDFRLLIEVAERKAVADMLNEIKKDPVETTTTRLFRELTFQEDGIEQTSRNINLDCCLIRTRAKLPVRGKNCAHLECYDATAYLQLNQTSRATWLCPECNKSAPFKDLIIDQFMLDLLEFSKASRLKLTVEDNYVIASEIEKHAPVQIHDEREHSNELIILS